MRRSQLERELSQLAGFDAPSASLEQYRTPSDVAAHLCHLATLYDDLDRPVVDLGCGTGVLALGSVLAGAKSVLGIERDRDALVVAQRNARQLSLTHSPQWIQGDVSSPPIDCGGVTVVMNPPFGAQKTNVHADRPFLRTAAEIGAVSYSIHNAGSQEFLTAFVGDHGGTITHAFSLAFDLTHSFEFHAEGTRTIDAEAYRIEW